MHHGCAPDHMACTDTDMPVERFHAASLRQGLFCPTSPSRRRRLPNVSCSGWPENKQALYCDVWQSRDIAPRRRNSCMDGVADEAGGVPSRGCKLRCAPGP